MRAIATFVLLLLISVPIVGLAGDPPPPPPRLISMNVGDDLKFSIPRIVAKPGEPLKVRLSVTSVLPASAMSHNFVLLKIGTDINKLVMEGARHRDRDFIPPSMAAQVIAQTPLAGNSERVEVVFNAPKQPGTYPFICTFSGHYQSGAKGELIVK
jgi:azurin